MDSGLHCKTITMKSLPVPRPSTGAVRYYNTLLFHGYFKAFITLLSLVTGTYLLFDQGYYPERHHTIRWMHFLAGWFGVYLVAFHLLGYYLCSAVWKPKMTGARQNLADSGWIMLALMGGSVVTGVMLWQGGYDRTVMRFVLVLHVGVALCYIALAVTHFHYYWNHWKPALRRKESPESANPRP